MNKKMFSCLTILLLLSITFTGFSHAARVDLYTHQTSAWSSSIGLQKSAYLNGTNSSTSARGVWLIAQVSPPGSGWSNKKEILLEVGSQGSFTHAETSNVSFAAELNPYGWSTTGCRAWATIQ